MQESEGYVFPDSFNQTLVQTFNLADVNGDGLKDIVLVINIGSNLGEFYILKNLGNGTFQSIGRKVIGANIYSIVAENLNDDGYIDYIMTTHLGVVIGYGSDVIFPTTFEQRDENIFEYGLVVKDFNSDGKQDFAVVPYLNTQIRVFLKDGNTFPQTPVIYQTAFQNDNLKSIDFNRDGVQDFIISDPFGGDNQILYGSSDGTFNSSEIMRYSVGTGEIVAADFNNRHFPRQFQKLVFI